MDKYKFKLEIDNKECPYCYELEKMFCSHVSVQKRCNSDDCPMRESIVSKDSNDS